MFIRYSFNRLSPSERALLNAVLLEEMEFQSWFAIVCSSLLQREIIVTLH